MKRHPGKYKNYDPKEVLKTIKSVPTFKEKPKPKDVALAKRMDKKEPPKEKGLF
jgi:hypothetical protein